MFENEIKSIENMEKLSYKLARFAGDAGESAADIHDALEVFVNAEPEYLADGNDDLLLQDMVRAERNAARDLARFDRVLNKIIVERIKLGDFIVTL